MNVLLDVSQITSGKLRLVPAQMNLSELVGGVIEEHRPLLSQSGSDLAIDIEERMIGNLDSTAVTQIVDNLLSNAIKYGQGKRIELSLTKQQDHVELSRLARAYLVSFIASRNRWADRRRGCILSRLIVLIRAIICCSAASGTMFSWTNPTLFAKLLGKSCLIERLMAMTCLRIMVV